MVVAEHIACWNRRWGVLNTRFPSPHRNLPGYTSRMSAMEPIDTREFPLDHEPIDDWQRIEDWQRIDAAASAGETEAPTTTAFAELGTIAGADYGLWEMSAGAMRDVEGDEVFLVVSGSGRIEFDEPSRPGIALSAGTLVRLEDGMKTRWFIDDAPLRKLFIAPHED